jgi:hypothetical protein
MYIPVENVHKSIVKGTTIPSFSELHFFDHQR